MSEKTKRKKKYPTIANIIYKLQIFFLNYNLWWSSAFIHAEDLWAAQNVTW